MEVMAALKLDELCAELMPAGCEMVRLLAWRRIRSCWPRARFFRMGYSAHRHGSLQDA
jgi:hypothetical protein